MSLNVARATNLAWRTRLEPFPGPLQGVYYVLNNHTATILIKLITTHNNNNDNNDKDNDNNDNTAKTAYKLTHANN